LVHYLEPAQIEGTITKIDPGKEIRVMRSWPNTPEGKSREADFIDFMRDHPIEKCITVRVPPSYPDNPNPFCFR
jgi:hypothetical protein